MKKEIVSLKAKVEELEEEVYDPIGSGETCASLLQNYRDEMDDLIKVIDEEDISDIVEVKDVIISLKKENEKLKEENEMYQDPTESEKHLLGVMLKGCGVEIKERNVKIKERDAKIKEFEEFRQEIANCYLSTGDETLEEISGYIEQKTDELMGAHEQIEELENDIVGLQTLLTTANERVAVLMETRETMEKNIQSLSSQQLIQATRLRESATQVEALQEAGKGLFTIQMLNATKENEGMKKNINSFKETMREDSILILQQKQTIAQLKRDGQAMWKGLEQGKSSDEMNKELFPEMFE